MRLGVDAMNLSILIPTYNRYELLRRLVLSMLKQQTAHRFEVWIANDGSTDLRVDTLVMGLNDNAFRYRFLNVQVSDIERRAKVRYSVLFNQLTPLARGELLWYVADDSELMHHSVQTVVDFFNAHPTIQAGYVGQRMRTADYRTGEYTDEGSSVRIEGLGGPVAKAHNVLDLSQVVVRRSVAPHWVEDADYWQSADGRTFDNLIASVGPLVPIGDPLHDPLIVYKITESSVVKYGLDKALERLDANR